MVQKKTHQKPPDELVWRSVSQLFVLEGAKIVRAEHQRGKKTRFQYITL